VREREGGGERERERRGEAEREKERGREETYLTVNDSSACTR